MKIIFHDKNEKCEIDSTKNVITLNLNKLSYKEKTTLEKIFKDYFNEDVFYFVEESNLNLLERLYSYKNKEDIKILDTLKSILSSSDWNALRDSLFLRNEFINQNGNLRPLKLDIINRYGERGNVISNLCTAGYFEQVMIPLCKKSITDFWHYYGIAVDKGIVALFVNNKMSIAKIRGEITHKLTSAKKYGLEVMHIHGIGQKNIKKIQDFLDQESIGSDFEKSGIYHNEKLHIYVVELVKKQN